MSSDLTVAINATSLLSPLTGIGQYTFHLITELQKLLPNQPKLFYGSNWDNELRKKPLPAIRLLKRIIKHGIPNSYRVSRLLQQYNFTSGIKKKDVHLYHEPNFVAYNFSGPTVITVHDLSYVRYRDTHPIERIRYMDSYFPKSLAAANHIIVNSEFVKQEVMTYYGISQQKITTTLLGVDALFRPYTPEQCHEALHARGLNYGSYILTVGTLEPRKNLAVVLKAFATLKPSLRKQYPLVIVGMKGWLVDDLYKQLENMVKAGEVVLTGYLPREQLPMLYSGATVCAYPSFYEGFGLPPLEAMSCGTPVLVSNCAAMPEVVSNAGVLIDPQNVENWSFWLQEMIENTNMKSRYRGLGIEHARSFTWERCAKQTVEVYKNIMTR